LVGVISLGEEAVRAPSIIAHFGGKSNMTNPDVLDNLTTAGAPSGLESKREKKFTPEVSRWLAQFFSLSEQ